MAIYSFLDVKASIVGPGISLLIGTETGVAKEGISVTMQEDKNKMDIGADGGGMHSLHASTAGRISVRLLKANPINHQLSAAYNFQRTGGGANWGANTIQITNMVRGDNVTAIQCAFVRQPDFVNAEDGGIVNWEFDAIKIQEILGDGTPQA